MRHLLCFGDSNTHGTRALRFLHDRRRLARAERWPGVLEAALGAAWQVIEEGHPGRTTVHADPVEGAHKNGLAALPALLESHRPLDLVILMLGTNDLKARFAVPAYDIALSVERLVTMTAASDSGPEGAAPAVLLVAPAPIEERGFLAESFAGGADKSRRLAGHLREMAERQRIPFFDAGGVAAVDPLDGIHLGAEAHARLGVALAEVVHSRWP